VGAGFSAPVQTGPGAHPASCTKGTGSFPGVKNGRGVTLTPHPLLVLWSRKGRAIPLFPHGPYGLYRASVPVQSLSACTRVHFTFTYISTQYCCFSVLLYKLKSFSYWFLDIIETSLIICFSCRVVLNPKLLSV
jgi:hypothetical protein